MQDADARIASQQETTVGHRRGVGVDIHDPGIGCVATGDIVDVADGGDAGADVEELPDTGRRGEVVDGAAQEGSVGTGLLGQIRYGMSSSLRNLPVGGEVVGAAEEVVVDAGGVRCLSIRTGMPAAKSYAGKLAVASDGFSGRWDWRVHGWHPSPD